MSELLKAVPQEQLPAHIAIVMDGNGRWAQKKNRPRTWGHKQGAKTFGNIAKYCRKIGIRYLTVYAFSTENWKRPPEEVKTIMDLLRQYLNDAKKHQDEDARICFLGDPQPLDQDIRELIAQMEEKSAKNTAITVNIALNYGGRDEIIRAAKLFAQDCVSGKQKPGDIDGKMLERYLYTAEMPDPDIIIRPSGEFRLSNFLLWQCAYSEFIFTDVLWPDFSEEHLDRAILEYMHRTRRFGGL